MTTERDGLSEPEGVNATGGDASPGADVQSGGDPGAAPHDENEMHPSPLGGAPWQDPDQPDGTPSHSR